MFIVCPLSSQHIEETAKLFDRYRVNYKMKSKLSAAKAFIQERVLDKKSLFFIALNHNTPVGFAQIFTCYSSLALKKTWRINDLFVDENYRRKGCALDILKFVEHEAKRNRIFSIKLSTETTNKAADGLYKKANFQIIEGFQAYSLRIK